VVGSGATAKLAGGGGGGQVISASLLADSLTRYVIQVPPSYSLSESEINLSHHTRIFRGDSDALFSAAPGESRPAGNFAGGRSYTIAVGQGTFFGGVGYALGNPVAAYAGGGGAGNSSGGSSAFLQGNRWYAGNGGNGVTISSDLQTVLGYSVLGSGGAGAVAGSTGVDGNSVTDNGSPGSGGGPANGNATSYGSGGGGNYGVGKRGVVVVSYPGTRAGEGGDFVVAHNGKTFHVFTSNGELQL